MPGSSPGASPGARPPLSRSLSSAASNATTRWGPASLTGALASPHPHPTPRSLHVLDSIPGRQSSGHHRRRGGEAGGGGPASSPDGFPREEEIGATVARLSGAAGRRKVRDSAERSAARGRRRRGLERLLREPMAARWLRRWQRRGTRRPRPPGRLLPGSVRGSCALLIPASHLWVHTD